MRRLIVLTATAALAVTAFAGSAAAQDNVKLRVLVHQNPPFVAFMDEFNAQFEADNPGVEVDMAVVNANDILTSTQTRLTANDVDVVDIFAFHNQAQPYMQNTTPPGWQTLIEGGNLMDLTDQPFVANYDPAVIAEVGSYNDRVYAINLGRIAFSGIFVNEDMLAENGIEVPTTWSELVTACETLKSAGIGCMTAGGRDQWPIFVGAYGLVGAAFPDQAAAVEAIWTGEVKYTDPEWLDLLAKYQVYNRDMIEAGAGGIPADGAPGRFVSGAVAMLPGGMWYAPAIESTMEEFGLDFEWSYVPFPGSDDPANNQYLFGKYDQGWAIAENSPNKEAALAYLTAFSEPDTYQAFVNAVGFIPTQPGATLDTKLGEDIAPYVDNFQVGWELYWTMPQGAGQYANPPQVNMFQPFGPFDAVEAAAEQAQSDLDSGLDAIQ
jgi:raffinose/stachyose/melibiose transport system substrate-binding protein